jgi:hypothetical protein
VSNNKTLVLRDDNNSERGLLFTTNNKVGLTPLDGYTYVSPGEEFYQFQNGEYGVVGGEGSAKYAVIDSILYFRLRRQWGRQE